MVPRYPFLVSDTGSGSGSVTTIDGFTVTGVRYQGDLSAGFYVVEYYANPDGTQTIQLDYIESGSEAATNQPPRNSNGLTQEEQSSLVRQLQAFKATLEDLRRSDGRDPTLVLPNGTEFKASELIDSLGKTLDIIEAGLLIQAISDGNASVGEVAGFLAGVFFGGALVSAGAGAMATIVAVAAVGLAVQGGVDALAAGISRSLRQSFDAAYEERALGNPPLSPGQWIVRQIIDALTPAFDEVNWDSPSHPVDYQEP